MDAVVIDFETRSQVDLKKAGVYNYATHPSTDILCIAASDLKTGHQWLWTPHRTMPDSLLSALNNPHNLVIAHNAAFDRAIWEYVAVNDYGFPGIEESRWYCSAAQCRVNALPSGLDTAIQALTGRKQKMAEGNALIKALSIPQADGSFNNDPALLRKMQEYCLQDVRVTCDLVNNTRPMTPQEHNDWLVSEDINDRGVRVDIPLAKAATRLSQKVQDDLSTQLSESTGGVVTKTTQHQRACKWVYSRLLAENITPAIKIMTKHEDGKEKISMDKVVRVNLLTADENDNIILPDDVFDTIDTMQTASNTSIAKFQKMVDLASPEDERVRGAFIFSGASQTGRFSSKGLQVHNFKRACFNPEQAEVTRARIIAGKSVPATLETLTKLLRPAIIPAPGKVFVVCDWSAIEARILPWLTESAGGKEVLGIFRRGEDIYIHTAERMRMKDRQIGKVSTLALGYQGGVNAFNSMARNYGLYLPETQSKRVVDAWRESNPWAVRFWHRLNNAVLQAVKYPEIPVSVGRVTYVFAPKLIDGTLLCILPDETIIQYPRARTERIATPFGTMVDSVTYLKASLSPKQGAKEWPRAALYGGLLAENITQGTAAGLLKHVLRELDDDGLVALHVHDEVVLEVEQEGAEETAKDLQSIMETPPEWAAGLPLKAVPTITKRYGK